MGDWNFTDTRSPWTPAYTENPSWPTYPTWSPYIPERPILTPTPGPENSLFINLSLAVRVVLFVACLIENIIAIYVLCKTIKKGRKRFSRYILINMASADILINLLIYPVKFVYFHHGQVIWVVEGHYGDVLCKIYTFLFEIPGRVLILSLVALACDVTRNLSSTGRKEHTRNFSTSLIVFFWIFAAITSIMYISTAKVERKKCVTDGAQKETARMMHQIHLYVFVILGDLILTILNLVVFLRFRRRKREIKRKREAMRAGRMREAHRKRRIEDNKHVKIEQWRTDDAQEPMLSNNGWCQPGGKHFPAGAIPHQQSNSSNPSETLVEVSDETKIFNEVDKANDSCDVHVDQEDGGNITADESDQEESIERTREEAKITSVASILFVILSISQLMFQFVCELACPREYYEYVAFAIEIAKGVYAAIKPGIYACIDKEFRKRYTQLSPLACCCFRRIRCHKEPNQVGTRKPLSTPEGNV